MDSKDVKHIKSLWILWFMAFIFFQGGASESRNLIFRTVSPQGGFTQRGVEKILQDHLGFIWITTQVGIFKYDSYTFTEYNCQTPDLFFNDNDIIKDIMIDSENRIWVASTNGLYIYNRNTDRFDFLEIDAIKRGLMISCIEEDWEGNICVNQAKNLFFLNSDRKIERVILLPHSNVRKIFVSNDRKIYVAFADHGIFEIIQDSEFRQIIPPGKFPLRSVSFGDSVIYIGYDGEGLKKYSRNGKLLKHYTQEAGQLSHNIVNIIHQASSEELWVGTYRGLDIFHKDTRTSHYNHNLLDPNSIPYSSVYAIYEDSKNGFWIGTYSGGLAYCNPFDNNFYHIYQHLGKYSISNNYISSFGVDQDGFIWVGTERGGLNRTLTNSDPFNFVQFNFEKDEPMNIKSILCTKENDMYIGTFKDGLYFVDKRRNAHRIKVDPIEKDSEKIYAFAETDSGIWVGDYRHGLFYILKENHKIKDHYKMSNDSLGLTSSKILALYIHKGDLWIGTYNGLNVKPAGKNYFKHYVSKNDDPALLRSSIINTFASDLDGNLWIGTRNGGLNMFDAKSESFLSYTMKDGLGGNDINGMLCDDQGYLWISTENGISRFDPKDGSVNNYNETDGLQGKQFISGAAYKSPDGRLFFGGTNGFTVISPDQIKINPVEPRPIISDLIVNNRRILAGDPESPLSKPIFETEELKLKYSQASVKLEFVSDNYLNPSKNRYAFRLLGYDDIWQYSTVNHVSYSNLNPGKYTFELNAANNDGVWSSEPIRLKLTILLPWWRNPIAFIVYIVLVVSTFIFLRRNILYRERMKSAVEIEKLKRISEEKIHQLKLQFFTNVSHEFKTPLTLILSPIQRLISKRDLDPEIQEDLRLVEKNSLRLKNLITQLLQFRKIDQEKLTLSVSHADVVSVCESVYSCFNDLAERKKIDYAFHPVIDNRFVWMDVVKMEDALFNILSNAFNYTEEGGQIQFTIRNSHPPVSDGWSIYTQGNSLNGHAVYLEITDTGIGIPPRELSKIFERFYQIDNRAEKSGNGVGLSLAKDYILYHGGMISVASLPGEGSRFVIGLPMGKEHFQNQPHVVFSDDVSRTAHLRKAEFIPALIEQKEISFFSKQKKRETLLLIEDNSDLNHYLAKVLSEHYQVIRSVDGEEGYQLVNRFLPEVVISDIMLPGLTGLEICQKIKDNPLTSHIPVILITALSEDVHQIEGLGKGADAYLSKPLDIQLLYSTVQNMIENRNRLRISYGGIHQSVTRDENISAYDHNLIKRLQAYILKNISTPEISTTQLAYELNTSRTNLHRKLKSLLGMSTTEYIRKIRLEKAREMLETTDLTLSEICYEVGFNSNSYFSTSFKELYGVNPSEYKRFKENTHLLGKGRRDRSMLN